MKTTVEIAGPLFDRAKAHCANRGISFRELIETGLRAALDPPKAKAPFRLKPFGFRGEGQVVHDWAAIREMAYEGRGGTNSGVETKPAKNSSKKKYR
jgi:hypothetical protein